jgi:hypothetical protein
MELLHFDEQTDMAKLTGAKRCDMHVIWSTGKKECWKTINGISHRRFYRDKTKLIMLD